ncbi:hypothetical protein HMPREF9103_02897 [Lentilactobacillus parafarraginis F0439]|uniref:Uncharacterized protein n=1 Tax=Lentilactobacillus parafarraginis F0439 TaxID=797515 RepID=G9ZSY0_9LACO|nr:hypothetical protein [Lentilactobacillus parafarraginis]EHL95697.1 hypothetical protein HMPREF9103_02897 [Lentilactobacillus parafarraginis F0439]
MAVFSAYNHDQLIEFLKENAPHAEIHVDDDVSAKHSANGKAQDMISGQILAYVAVGDVDDAGSTRR